jgi:large subunit ribosomal protein L21
MYAIISDGGKQYRVEEGQEFDVDFRDIEKGSKITFDSVLAVNSDDEFQLGKPEVSGASVSAEVIGSQFGEKLVVQKFRRRKNSRRKTGQRQVYTRVRIDKISC